jgi:hypothetical protein
MPMDLPYPRKTLTLYHGTIPAHAEAMLTDQTIKFEACARRSDFGQGFYTTSVLEQARDWADKRTKREVGGGPGTVLKVDVEVDQLAALRLRAFAMAAESDPNGYWEFVRWHRSERQSTEPQGANDVYDVVIGPVAASGAKPETPPNGVRRARSAKTEVWTGYDQISFHTERALQLINNRLQVV